MARTSRWRALIAVLLSALLSIVITASVSWTLESGPIPASDHPFLEEHPVVVLTDRFVCSLLGSQQSKAGVVGADGSHSVAVDGVVYWNFGDTVLANGRVIPNSLGWSSDRDASDCITLVPKGTTASSAPLLPRDPDSEQSVWPLGMEETSAGIVHFFYASVVRKNGGEDGEVEVAGVGLASFDAETLEAERAWGGALPWPAGGPLPSRTFADEEYVYVLHTVAVDAWATDTVLARVPKTEIESLSSYEYWQAGDAVTPGRWLAGLWDEEANSWRPELSEIETLWRQTGNHNGVELAYNEFLGRWLAVYASNFMTAVSVRAAEELTGPWDGPETMLVRCPAFHESTGEGFVCYTGAQHEVYARDGGRTIYVTYSNGGAYEVYLHEIRLAAGIRQWRDTYNRAIYLPAGAEPPVSFAADGLAFYASDIPVPGFSAIHRWVGEESGAVRYGAAEPISAERFVDRGIDFYAPLDASTSDGRNDRFAPVYRWTQGDAERYAALDLAGAGYERHEIAFYAACPDRDNDTLTDCFESFLGTDASSADTDGDGLLDAYERDTPGCDPLVYNDDGDGIPSQEEVLAGTNPCFWGGRVREALSSDAADAGST